MAAGGGQQIVRTSSGQLLQLQPGQARAPVSAGAASNQRVVIPHPGAGAGGQISVPLATLQTLQPGQGIPTGTPGHLLVKTATGQYQIVKVPTTAAPAQPQQRPAAPALPTQPVSVSSTPAASSVSSSVSAGVGGMGQQMTPDTAKVKCKNFLATLLRLASDQPETVARNVRTLIQVIPALSS